MPLLEYGQGREGYWTSDNDSNRGSCKIAKAKIGRLEYLHGFLTIAAVMQPCLMMH